MTRVLVTVGSTGFDLLVQTVISDAFLDALHAKGFTDMTIQYGSSKFHVDGVNSDNFDYSSLHSCGIDIHLWKYKPSILAEMENADLVISHAGSGTVLEALRMHKALIVVPNTTLLDNHQIEVARALEAQGHLKSSTVVDLVKSIVDFNPEKVNPFPPFDGTKFARLVDEEMGFV
ncbi:hypothetical protein APHAL10511_002333 [Amanita phalloides]|nr:hypothetical protein APHAL10511_002333 [Amanita phalloides]